MKTQKYNLLFFLITFSLISFKIDAQNMNLEECIAHAIDNNIQLKQAEINTQISSYDVQNNKFNLLPSLNANASLSNNLGRSIDPFTNQFVEGVNSFQSTNYSVSSQVTLYNGLTKLNNIKQSQINYDKSVLDYQKSKNDIILAVASNYLQVLMAKENLKGSQLQVENSKEQLSRVKSQVDAGALPLTNLLEIKTQLATDEFNQVNAINQLEIAKLNLAQLLDITSPNFDITDPDLDMVNLAIHNYNEENIFVTAKTVLPEIKSAELGVESAVKGVQLARGTYAPSLTLNTVIFTGTSSIAQQLVGFDTTGLFPTPIYGDYPFSDQINNNIRQQASLNLSIPIFNGMNSRIQVQRSKLNYQIAQLNEQNIKNQLRKDIQKAYTDYKAAAKRYQSAKNQLNAAEENYKNAKVRFEQGILSTTDYRTILNNKNATEADLLNSKYDFVFKQKILDFYQGKEIKL